VGRLIYATNTSLDGFTEDASGAFDFSVPGEALHRSYNDLMRGVDVQLLGRRMYETMAVWETDPAFHAESPILAEFAAAWQDSDKVVFSTTLAEPVTNRTRIVRSFDAEAIRVLADATQADLLVGGPELAGHALRAGLVDEIRIVVFPVAVGSGKRALPSDLRLDLELLEQERFGDGTVRIAYRVVR